MKSFLHAIFRTCNIRLSGTGFSILLVCVATAFVGIVGVDVLRAANYMAWKDLQLSNIQRLATALEWFRINEGSYPKTLAELATNEFTIDRKSLLIILNDETCSYGYQVESNGFVIIANGPSGFFHRREGITNRFPSGDMR